MSQAAKFKRTKRLKEDKRLHKYGRNLASSIVVKRYEIQQAENRIHDLKGQIIATKSTRSKWWHQLKYLAELKWKRFVREFRRAKSWK